MNLNQNFKAFLKNLPLAKMTGHEKFLAVAAFLVGGKEGVEVRASNVESKWPRTFLRVKYNPTFYVRAQTKGWVVPTAKGSLSVSAEGLAHLTALGERDEHFRDGELEKSGALIIVKRKGSHSFDKLLRKLLADAKGGVLIADSYVDGTIFDTVLDAVPRSTTIRLLYNHRSGNFEQRAKRFSGQYPRFASKRYKHLHDRFLVIGESGYIVGPSLKDAATNSPALMVVLAGKEKRRLQSFF